MDAYHTIVRPLVTEKSTGQAQKKDQRRGGAYAFEVPLRANKAQIKDAVEKIYGVKVLDVRTSIKPGRSRRTKIGYTQRQDRKKAIVVLGPDSHIDLF